MLFTAAVSPIRVAALLVCSFLLVLVVLKVFTHPVVPWHADRFWHEAATFPLCSMDVCFNFSPCENSRELLVYTYEASNPPWPATYFSNLNTKPWHTSDPKKACLFFVFLDKDLYTKGVPPKPHPNTLPHWNNGLNHVLVTFADRWSKNNPPGQTIGKASLLSSDLHETTYRPGFDIAIPLPRIIQYSPPELQNLKPFDRKYFATFKGTRLFKDEGSFRSSNAFREMHNSKDVIVLTQCKQKTNDKLRKWHPELGGHCEEDEKIYNSYDYQDLLNSTFGLTPAGRSPSSYRFLENLASGTIPVVIADNYVKPFDSLIQWQRCLLQFPTYQIDRILPTLRSLSKEEVVDRQRYCLFVFHEFLKDDATLINSVMRALKSRFFGMLANVTLKDIYPTLL